MSLPTKIFQGMIEEKLLHLHTAFLGRIVSVDFDNQTASVQPLTLSKQIGGEAFNQSVLTDIPVTNQARFKYYLCEELREDKDVPKPQCEEEICEPCGKRERREIRVEKIKKGDIAVCIVCERDISQAVKGVSSVPAFGRHEMKDSVVIGVL